VFWFCLVISFVFSGLSFIGAGFAFIGAMGVLVFRQFLSLRVKIWKMVLLFLSPVLGQSLGLMAFAFGPGF